MQNVIFASGIGLVPRVSATDGCRARIEADLDALSKPWAELEARADATVFQSYAWCSLWAEAARRAGCPETARIVTVWQGSRLVLLWPLALRRLGPLKILHGFGDPASQYGDALIERDGDRARWLELAWDQLRALRGVHALHLKAVRADAALGPLLEARGERFVTRRDVSPFADFRPDAPPVSRSGRTRNALKRHLRLLGGYGETAFTVVTDPRERAEAIRDAVRLKQAWIARTAQVSAGYGHPANRHFLEALAGLDDFLILRLSVGGRIAAIEAGLLRDGRYYSMVQTYDARYALHGPGRLLFFHMVERPAAFGIEVLDFLAPTYRHKSEWANGEMPVRDYVIPLRPVGWLMLGYVRHARPRLKAGLQWLRRHLRSRALLG